MSDHLRAAFWTFLVVSGLLGFIGLVIITDGVAAVVGGAAVCVGIIYYLVLLDIRES